MAQAVNPPYSSCQTKRPDSEEYVHLHLRSGADAVRPYLRPADPQEPPGGVVTTYISANQVYPPYGRARAAQQWVVAGSVVSGTNLTQQSRPEGAPGFQNGAVATGAKHFMLMDVVTIRELLLHKEPHRKSFAHSSALALFKGIQRR